MRSLALCVLCSLIASSGGAAAAPPGSIPGGVFVVASDRDDLDLVARPLAGGAERVLLGGLDNAHSPTVSTDGRTVVFIGRSTGRAELLALDLESGSRRALTDDARYEHAPAFSPDGSELAYVSSRDCRTGDHDCDRLVVMTVASGRSRVLLTGSRLFDPAWSADGRRVAFVRDGSLWVVDSEGEAASRVSSSPDYRQPSWSPDGRRIVVQRSSGSVKSPPSLTLVDVATGRATPLYGVSGVAPVWLSSGRIRFLGAGSDLFDVNPDGTGRARVTTSGGLSADWAASSEEVIFTRNVGGRSLLYELGGDGRASRRLSERAATLPSCSPDGRSIAFVARTARTSSLYVVPAGGGNARMLARTPRWILSKPSWSPDGKRIAFEIRGGIGTVAKTGGVVRHVRGTVRSDESPAWSPDGREIAFSRLRRTTDRAYRDTRDVLAVNPRTGRLRAVVRNGWGPAWSPNGRSIAFASDRGTFDSSIWIARRDGTARIRLTGGQGSGFSPAWSPDGRHLAFLRFADGPTPGNSGLWLKRIGGGAARRIASDLSSFTWGPRGS